MNEEESNCDYVDVHFALRELSVAQRALKVETKRRRRRMLMRFSSFDAQ